MVLVCLVGPVFAMESHLAEVGRVTVHPNFPPIMTIFGAPYLHDSRSELMHQQLSDPQQTWNNISQQMQGLLGLVVGCKTCF